MFDGEVVGLAPVGAFVAFGEGYEGLLPVRRLRGDWWELDELGTILHGTKTGGAIRLGDPVRVQVGRIDSPRGQGRPLSRGQTTIVGPCMAKKGKRKAAPGDIATNRQAAYRYNLLERIECGIVLTGTEVKSLREGTATIKDGYADVRDGELWLHNVHIPPYAPASRENHEPERDRKLLVHRRELERLIGKTKERGLTIVPTRIYFRGPHAKVEIALARGKDVRDKRETIRARDTQREIDRELREARR